MLFMKRFSRFTQVTRMILGTWPSKNPEKKPEKDETLKGLSFVNEVFVKYLWIFQ